MKHLTWQFKVTTTVSGMLEFWIGTEIRYYYLES